MNLDELYQKSCREWSDIYEHVPVLRDYASEVSSIAEFGVRGTNNSTHGLIKGLSESRAEGKKSYFGVDIKEVTILYMKDIAESLGIDFSFIVHDSATVDMPEVDLLFIDSWHVYGHLKRELQNNHTKVKKYIIMHDTTSDEWYGEPIRMGWNVKEQAEKSGYPEEEVSKGLWPAVEEFLQAHPEWTLKERRVNNNGLTVLARRP
jgi:hypothetical protein